MDIREGGVLDRNNYGLGAGVRHDHGRGRRRPELGSTIALLNSGISAGVEVEGAQHDLNGLGDPGLGDTAALNILPAGTNPNNVPAIGPLSDPITTTEALWGGPVNLGTTLAVTFQGTLGPRAAPENTLTANITSLTGTGITATSSPRRPAYRR